MTGKTQQHYNTKLCNKKNEIAIFRTQVPKNHVEIELGILNFEGRLEVNQIDCKKSFKVKEHLSWEKYHCFRVYL